MEEAKSNSEGTKNNPPDKSKKKSLFKILFTFYSERECVQRSGNLTEVGSGLPPKDFQGLNSHFQD